jgi:hypothetical protein
MNLPRLVARWIPATLSLAMVSCIDVSEEVWIESNGSGRAAIEAEMSSGIARLHGGEAGIRKQIAGLLETSPAIRDPKIEITTAGGKVRVLTRFSFDSASDLMASPEPQSPSPKPSRASHLIGEIQTVKDGRTLRISRSTNPGKAFPGATLLPASQFEGYHLTTTLHLPSRPLASNAKRVENDGKTLIWEQSLAQALKSPVEQQLSLQSSIPWLPLVGTATALTLTFGLFIRGFRRRARSGLSSGEPG